MDQPVPRTTAESDTVEVVQLNGSFANFGALVDFLAGIQPFAGYDLGNFARALQHQLSTRSNVAAVDRGRIVGYCGWLATTTAVARAWLEGNGPLTPSPQTAEALVATVVAAGERRVLAAMARKARSLNPGRRIYFKRHYVGGGRLTRKSSVRNVRRS